MLFVPYQALAVTGGNPVTLSRCIKFRECCTLFVLKIERQEPGGRREEPRDHGPFRKKLDVKSVKKYKVKELRRVPQRIFCLIRSSAENIRPNSELRRVPPKIFGLMQSSAEFRRVPPRIFGLIHSCAEFLRKYSPQFRVPPSSAEHIRPNSEFRRVPPKIFCLIHL